MNLRRRTVPPVARPQLSIEEAAERLGRITETVARLTSVIVEETRLVRAGAYSAADQLSQAKGELSGRYMLDLDALSANAEAIAAQPPEAVDEMKALHADFRAALDENLAVLGTARSVAESLMRGVAEEIGAKATPRTYTARGRATGGKPKAAPLALSRGA